MSRQEKIAGLFAAVIDVEQSKQVEFLQTECGSDTHLFDELKQLLEAVYHPRAAAFLSAPAWEIEAEYLEEAAQEDSDSRLGEVFGNYKILEKIGIGGMGTIYLGARTDDFEKRVAVKIIKRGMDTEAILSRFRTERQILANLEHPNIARLIDGGTTPDGLPFLVMEYVEGKPIDEYCREKNLDINKRIELFRSVCSAVSFAHRNLVVHRDLKPSNILVKPDGEPKLLDFGIAKLIGENDSDTATQTNLRVFTPAYASPEQSAGETITTATDVYSLGIILYELLTGMRPSELEIQNSKLKSGNQYFKDKKHTVSKSSLTGDLRNILAQSLRVEPERRYTSVEHFSDDLRRYNEGLPVTARSDTFFYRAQKFIKRNKIGVAVTIFIFLLLVAGAAVIVQEDRVARAERARATRRFNDVRALVNTFLFQLNDEMAKVSGTTPARKLLVQQTLEYLNNASRETGDDLMLERELATAYIKVGDIQGNPYSQNLGDTSGALTSYQKALEIYEQLVAKNPSSVEIKSQLAQIYRSIGDVLWDTGDLNSTLENYIQATKIIEELSIASPEDAKTRLLLARFYAALGDIKYDEGFQSFKDLPASFEEQNKALAIREQLFALDPENKEINIDLNQSYQRLANNYRLAGDFTKEFDFLQKSESIVKVLLSREPENPTRKREAAIGYARFVTYFIDAGEFEKANDYDQKSLALRQSVYDSDKIDARARRDLAFGYLIDGNLLTEKGDLYGALESYQKQLGFYQALAAIDSSNRDRQRDLVDGLINVGKTFLKMNDAKSALPYFNQALEISRTFPADDLQTRINLALIYEGIGFGLLAHNQRTEAIDENILKAIELHEAEVGEDKTNVIALAELAKLYLKAGKAYRSNEQLQKSMVVWNTLKAQNALRKIDLKDFEETKRLLGEN